MALADTLRERVSRRGSTAQVDCGALGTVTVEALPPRECAALLGKDGGRALLYAACRELQAAGETLRRERWLYAPDEVMQYVSDSEAAAAARTVLELSGVGPDKTESRLENVQTSEKELSEIRPGFVQEISPGFLLESENRLDSVQDSEKEFFEFRPEPVQKIGPSGDGGQVSREFFGDLENARRTQKLGANLRFRPLNIGVSGENAEPLPGAEPPEKDGKATESPGALHETTSEFRDALHEITSDFGGKTGAGLHETASEFRDTMHETTSDFGGKPGVSLHEVESEFRDALHETTSEFAGEGQGGLHETESEFRGAVHETTSEFDEKRRGAVHEITSESAEKLAEYLLEGLRRAAAAR